jgi:putative glutamine amidotransferase
MGIRVAIPLPSSDQEYNGRSLPAYIAALDAVGAEAVVVELGRGPSHVAKQLVDVQGILLPGSRFDVDPVRYGETPIAECGPADEARAVVDELLLEGAFRSKKPILGICHGTQMLNVWRSGSLVQHLQTEVNHSPGRTVMDAHPVRVAEGSRLAAMLPAGSHLETQVNSSHHQAVRLPGTSLRIAAVSPVDGVIEAVELESAEHFVVGVQWHPERTYVASEVSRAIFRAFVDAAAAWRSSVTESPTVAE